MPEWGGGGVASMLLALSGDKAVRRPYTQVPWVYACIAAVSRAFASTRPAIVKRNAQGEDEELTDHALVQLFQAPNPLQSPRKFLRQLANYHQHWGELYLLALSEQPDEDGGRVMQAVPATRGEGISAQIRMPQELWPIAGHLVEPVMDRKSQLPVAYRVRSEGGTREYPAHALTQISDANPYSVLHGVGPMTAALRSAGKLYIADAYDEALLQNGGSPGGVLTADGPLSPEEIRAIGANWKETHGRPDQRGKTAVLPKGITYKESGFTPKDMEFGSMRLESRQEILSVFGVTKTVLGITDDVNRANAREALRAFWENTVLPLVSFFEDEINYRFLRRIQGAEGLRLVLDTSAIEALREDRDAQIERTSKLWAMGRSYAEAATTAGLEIDTDGLEGADERYIPASMVPVELAHNPPQPPGPGEDDDEDEPDPDEETDDEPDGDEGRTMRPDALVQRAEAAAREAALLAVWKAHDSFLEAHELRFSKKVSRVYRRIFLAVRARVRDVARTAAAPQATTRFIVTEAELERLLQMDWAKWTEALFGDVKGPYADVAIEAAERVHAEVQGIAELLSENDQALIDFLASKRLLIREGWLSTLAKDIQRTIAGALRDAPQSVGSLAQAIAAELEKVEAGIAGLLDQTGTRAMRIARNEISDGASLGNWEQMRAENVTESTWVSARDSNVRPHHEELDGKTVPLGDTFGYSLRRPHDPNAPIGERAGCRCRLLAGRLEDDDQTSGGTEG